MTTFTVHCEYPVSFRAAVIVEAEDAVAACGAPVDAASDRTDRPDLGYDGAVFVSAIAEAADPDPWRTAPDGREISVLPVPRLFRNLAALAGYPATRSEDLVDQLCIMLDAIGADGGLRINPEAMVRLRQVGESHSRRYRPVRVGLRAKRCGKRGRDPARSHLTPDCLPPEGMRHMGDRETPATAKIRAELPLCGCPHHPGFCGFPSAAPAVPEPLNRPPKRCASGG